MSNNSGGTAELDKNSMKSAINDGKLADMKNDATETKREMITQRNVFKKKEFQVRPSLLRFVRLDDDLFSFMSSIVIVTTIYIFLIC